MTWVNNHRGEVHNVGFGPRNYISSLLRQTERFPQQPNGPNQIGPSNLYGTDPVDQ